MFVIKTRRYCIETDKDIIKLFLDLVVLSTNSEVRRRTGQPLLSDSTCQTPQAVWPRGSGGQVPPSLPCSPNMHMAHSQELEAASKSSETYLAENGGGRPASVQPRSCNQGSRRHRTELPGAHSRERLRHRQAPNDDDDDVVLPLLFSNTTYGGEILTGRGAYHSDFFRSENA